MCRSFFDRAQLGDELTVTVTVLEKLPRPRVAPATPRHRPGRAADRRRRAPRSWRRAQRCGLGGRQDPAPPERGKPRPFRPAAGSWRGLCRRCAPRSSRRRRRIRSAVRCWRRAHALIDPVLIGDTALIAAAAEALGADLSRYRDDRRARPSRRRHPRRAAGPRGWGAALMKGQLHTAHPAVGDRCTGRTGCAPRGG